MEMVDKSIDLISASIRYIEFYKFFKLKVPSLLAPRSRAIVSRGLKKVIPYFYASSVIAEDYLYSSAADYAGEKGILDDVVVIRYSCKCHAIQSRGSGDWFSGLRIIYIAAQQIVQMPRDIIARERGRDANATRYNLKSAYLF